MITIDFSVLKELLIAAASLLDLVLTAKLIIVTTPSFIAFCTLISMIGEKKRKFSVAMTTLILFLSTAYFALACGDVMGRKETFSAISGAAILSALMFFVLFAVYLALFFLSKPEKKKKFVARIVETPIKSVTPELKAYPLKGSADCKKTTPSDVNYREFTKFLQKINEKDLSFSDREEYNRITSRAGFLSGVAVTDKTAEDFCELFSASIKLAARYGVE